MEELRKFISEHRGRFDTHDGNIFGTGFGKIVRRMEFLEIIYFRHKEISKEYVTNSKALQATFLPGEHETTQEQMTLLSNSSRLGNVLHLDIESFYLFAKIMLDEVAHAIEHYFGSARGIVLDSHDDLAKNLERFAASKKLNPPHSLLEKVQRLKTAISDFRDYQIAHEKSPRTIKGTLWSSDGVTRMTSSRLYPKDADRQTTSGDIAGLRELIKDYTKELVVFIETNENKSRLKLKTGISP